MRETNVTVSPQDVGDLIDNSPMSWLQVRVIALCSLATFLDGYDVQALGVTIPRMAEAFNTDPSTFAIALSGSLIGMAIGAIILSPLADKFGRRNMLIFMMVLIGLTTLGATFATGPISLTIWRVLSGLGLGAVVPIGITMTSEYAPARHRARLITLMVVCTALGAFSAGFAAPMIEAAFGWRGIFGIGAVLPLLAALIFWFTLPESIHILAAKDPKHPDALRQAKQIAPDLSEITLIKKASELKSKVSVKSLFSSKLSTFTLLLWMIMSLNLFANYALISWLPTLLSSAGWPLAQAQQSVGFIALGGIVGGLFLAWLADKGWAFISFALAYAVVAGALTLFMLGIYTGPLSLIFAIIGIGAFGSAMALSSFSASFYPSEIRSTGVGWTSGIGRIGSIFGPLAIAAMMHAKMDPVVIIGLLMIPMVLCVICVLFLSITIKRNVLNG